MKKQARINTEELAEMWARGVNQTDMANRFGVSQVAISKALKKIKKYASSAIVKHEEKMVKVADCSINVMAQLKRINDEAIAVLEEGKKIADTADSGHLRLKACKVIEDQLALHVKISEMLFNMSTVKDFQDEVLEAIGEESPETRSRIVKRLQERRTIRWNISSPVEG